MSVTIRQSRRAAFHPLTVAAVDRLTEDAVMLTFAVPRGLRPAFAFTAGQHLTVRLVGDSTTELGEVRRSYSICSTPADLENLGVLRVGVREVVGGAFSRYATTRLRAGDTVEVLPPLGRFTTALDPVRTRHYAAIVAGSGITPVLSLVASALAAEPNSDFVVLYGNRTSASVMFAEELADLKDRYQHRLQLVHVLSREPQLSTLLSGRLDGQRLRDVLESTLVDAASVDEWFLCGPYEMVLDARAVLTERGVPDTAVKTELFHVEETPVPVRVRAADEPVGPAATVTIMLDGRESTFTMARDERVLDAALRVRGELPYACKGGVCSTCRAKVIEGAVEMARNYALEPAEVAAGYVLTCQSEPITERLVVDYDA